MALEHNTAIANFNKKSTTSKMSNPNQDSILTEALLYATDLQHNLNETDFKNFFKEIEPISVEIRRGPTTTAILRFSSIPNAEKAFACYNNNKMENNNNKFYLKLLFNDPNSNLSEPKSDAFILQVKQLPLNTNNLALYDLFRDCGPLFSCRIQYHERMFKGTALVQFYRQEDAEAAINTLNCSNYEGRSINVSQYYGKNNKNNNTPKINTNNVTNHNFNLQGAGHAFPPQGSNQNYNQGHNNNNNNNQSIPMSPGPEGPHVDPSNLFIKNLDANISSSDLFNHFRRFGRIISARVMRDQETGNSKGFGFVSYTTPEEADKAKTSMHGKTLGTKQIVVRLHEPKKLREAKLANHFGGSPTSPSDSRPSSRRNSDYFSINTFNEFGQEDLSGLAPKARKEVLMSELQKRFKNISVPPEEVNPIIEHLLTSKTQEILQMLKDPSLLTQKITETRSTILHIPHDKKRRSNEDTNVPTTSIISINSNIINNNNNNSNNFQQVSPREKFLKAINKICPRNSVEVLDLLMTLSPKERSLCYFNAEYLHKKIVEANGALEVINNDDDIITVTGASNRKSLISADLTSASTPPIVKSLDSITVPVSRPNYATEVSNGVHSPEYKEIEEFMDGLKNKPIHEQKQKLGDRLFPKVKSLGLKSAIASKVTINLLDTDDLRELAHSMNDTEKFEQKVSAAAQKVAAAASKPTN